uniref:Perilipin n=1 Tax=Pelodiscus sinensis TaxID=13735 RepID=K7F5N5_PELSI
MASPDHGEEEQPSVLKRVASLPVVSTACDLAATAYTSTKESHPYVKSLCDMAEKGVTSLTGVAASTEQPVPPALEPQVATGTQVTSEVPDKVEENLPTLQQTAEKLCSSTPQITISDTQELVSSRLTDVKESMIRAVDMTKEAMQDGMKTTRNSLSKHAKLRCPLQQTMGLIDYIKQGVKLPDLQEKFQHMWLNWNRSQPEGSEITDLATPEMESETLAMSRSILQQLQDACQVLVSSIQGLPANLQDKVRQVSRNMGELHASFSTARSFQDLSSSLLKQSQEMVTKAQEYVDELMTYMMQNTPLSWIVGPFAPSGKGSANSLEQQTQEAEAKEEEVATASKSD